jgi:adenylate cyclase
MLAGILIADVAGYSRLAFPDEDPVLAGLRKLRSDLIDPALALHHGRVATRTSEGTLVEFRSAGDAVRCAIEVLTAMVDRNGALPPERRIEFRVGIHLGDPVEDGDDVKIAGALKGVARPGAICLSEDVYRQMSEKLDMQVTDLGQIQLKNKETTTRAYLLEVGKPATGRPTMPVPPERRRGLALTVAGIAALLILIAAGAWNLRP